MNQVLMQAIIDTIMFLSLSQEDEVNSDSARAYTEDLSARLQDLTQEERNTFVKYIEDLILKLRHEGATEQEITFLESLPYRLALLPNKNQRYFVVRFGGVLPPKPLNQEFEVQVLDSLGRARMVGYIGQDETQLVIKGHSVPHGVLEAAHRLAPGEGAYVDELGQIIDPLTRTRELLKHTKPRLP